MVYINLCLWIILILGSSILRSIISWWLLATRRPRFFRVNLIPMLRMIREQGSTHDTRDINARVLPLLILSNRKRHILAREQTLVAILAHIQITKVNKDLRIGLIDPL